MTVHSLTAVAATATAATPFVKRRSNNNIPTPQFQKIWASSSSSHDNPPKLTSINVARRRVTLALTGALLSLGLEMNGSATAAARRPPPPPPTEKKDPNVSGALAKVLASKRRKEEMKEAMAKLREKGKVIS